MHTNCDDSNVCLSNETTNHTNENLINLSKSHSHSYQSRGHLSSNPNLIHHNSMFPCLWPDIQKCGYMRKLKTNRRKFFVLQLNSKVTLSKATLSYYDNEKKFRERQPKRIIPLSECFAVARIFDHKKFILGIYTNEDLLATVLEDENQLIDWLEAIRSVLYRLPEYLSRPLRDFSYIWQGTINKIGVGMPKDLLGTYRFCLMPTVLHFIHLDPLVEIAKHYEFPLSIIHRCGHKEKTFYLSIGRLSEIGAGEFWISTEDNVTAEHMHAKVSSFWALNNKNNKFEDNEDCSQYGTLPLSKSSATPNQSNSLQRSRSSSTSIVEHPINSGNPANTPLNHQMKAQHHHSLPFHHHSITPLVLHQMMAQYHSLCQSKNLAGNLSNSSQSPSNSRERLHSGSWSHTASDCSNEDLSAASSTATTPVGQMFWDSTHNHSASINQFITHNLLPNTCCHNHQPEHNKANSSTSSLSTEYDNDHSVNENHPIFERPIINSDLNPPIMSSMCEDKGFSADLNLYSNFHNMAASFCSNCFRLYYLQMIHQSSINCCLNKISNHSPATSPKCHCSMCLLSNPFIPTQIHGSCCNTNHHCLPTIPAGEPSDYVPMKPINNNPSNLENSTDCEISSGTGLIKSGTASDSNKNNSKQEDYYLHMAPLSPSLTTQEQNQITSASNSIELNLEEVKCYIKDDLTSDDKNKSPNLKDLKKIQDEYPDNTIFNGLTRAYSTGSKPQPLGPSLKAQCSTETSQKQPVSFNKSEETKNFAIKNAGHLRLRASSTGSHGMKFRAFHFNSKFRNKSLRQKPFKILNPNSEYGDITKSKICDTENLVTVAASKAASAPILSSLIRPRIRSHTLGSRPTTLQHLSHKLKKQQSSASMMVSVLPENINPLVFGMSPTMPDILSCLYGSAAVHPVSNCCNQHLNLNSNLCQHKTSSYHHDKSISQVSEESDLMELDYSNSNKERTHQAQNVKDIKIENNHSKIKGTDSKDLTDSISLRSKPLTPKDDRRQSESGSSIAVDSLSPKSNSKFNSFQTSNTTSSKTSSHTTLDHLVSSFKQTLSLSNGSKQSKHNSHLESDSRSNEKEEEYMLMNPSENRLPKSISLQPMPSKTFNDKNLSRNQTAAQSIKNESDNSNEIVSNCDEEEPLYVVMGPDKSSDNNHKKTKNLTMRSLFSTIGGSSPVSFSGPSIFRSNKSNKSNLNLIKRQLSSKSEISTSNSSSASPVSGSQITS